MPYVSQAQVGYLHANEPKLAARWDQKYGVPKNLPKKKSPLRQRMEEGVRKR